jgi:phosphatidylserine/phosphatidylglycerophosphate/cardiolipin synthase-like enzyme
MMQYVDIVPMTNYVIPFVPSASYPIPPGNLVRPLIDDEPAFRRICETIEAAQKSVWVTVTFMWSDFEMLAFHLFRKIARENRRKYDAGDHAWEGLAFELDLDRYVG